MSVSYARETATVHLYQRDDRQRIRELQAAIEWAALVEAKSVDPLRVGDEVPTGIADAVAAFNEFQDGAEERATKVQIEALPGRQWRELKLKHPPREGNERDADLGFNVDTLPDDLVPVSPTLDQFESEEERAEFCADLSDAHQTAIFWEAVELNQGDGPDPKARIGSLPTPASDETSDSPARLG